MSLWESNTIILVKYILALLSAVIPIVKLPHGLDSVNTVSSIFLISFKAT